MKKLIAITIAGLVTALVCIQTKGQSPAARSKPAAVQRYEYASVRFMGKNTSFVWPDGTVEKLYVLIPDFKRPSEADDRIYHLTMAINLAAKRGFEIAGMPGGSGGVLGTSDDVFFCRPVSP